MALLTSNGPGKIIGLYERLYGPDEITAEDLTLFYELALWPSLIETIGVLHHEQVLSTAVVYKMWGPQINLAWEVYEKPVERLREVAHSPTAYTYFETVARAMREAKIPAAIASAEAHRESQSAAAAAAGLGESSKSP